MSSVSITWLHSIYRFIIAGCRAEHTHNFRHTKSFCMRDRSLKLLVHVHLECHSSYSFVDAMSVNYDKMWCLKIVSYVGPTTMMMILHISNSRAIGKNIKRCEWCERGEKRGKIKRNGNSRDSNIWTTKNEQKVSFDECWWYVNEYIINNEYIKHCNLHDCVEHFTSFIHILFCFLFCVWSLVERKKNYLQFFRRCDYCCLCS